MNRPLMQSLRPKLMVLLASAALAVGCKPAIGDSCEISTDCSASGDRLCDITAPGGYCTVYGCDPDSCPDEATCIEFGSERSTVAGCADDQAPSPYSRTFCMFTCDSSQDCRSGYTCIDAGKRNDWGAVVIDTGRGHKVCVAQRTAAPAADTPSTAICRPTSPAESPAHGQAGAAGG